MREVFNHFWVLSSPFWQGSGRLKPLACLAGLVVLILVQTGLAVLINEQTGEFITALSVRDASRYWRAVGVCLLWLCGAVPVYAFFII